MVIQHREAINCIALSLIHKSLRTKALVLELLAAICLVKGDTRSSWDRSTTSRTCARSSDASRPSWSTL